MKFVLYNKMTRRINKVSHLSVIIKLSYNLIKEKFC